VPATVYVTFTVAVVAVLGVPPAKVQFQLVGKFVEVSLNVIAEFTHLVGDVEKLAVGGTDETEYEILTLSKYKLFPQPLLDSNFKYTLDKPAYEPIATVSLLH
jgi:hypothetical protein